MAWDIFAGILILNAFFAGWIAATLIVRRVKKAGSKTMIGLFAALFIWTLSYALITLSPSLNTKIFWLKVENIGIVFTPSLWFLFTLTYTKQRKRINKFLLALLLSVPVISLVLLFSGDGFDLYYLNVEPIYGTLGPLHVDGNTWYYVQLVHSYALLLAGFVILVQHLFLFRDMYRRRIVVLLAAVVIPFLLNVLYQMGVNVFPAMDIPVDLSPLSMTATAFLLSIAIFNQKLFEITPIARYVVLDHVIEMVLVVDEEDHILDVNQAAADWLGRPIKEIISKTLQQVLDDYPKIIEHYQGSKDNGQSFHLLTSPEHLEMTISPVIDRSGNLEGRVLVFHDVAQQRQMESDLKKANEELKAKLAEIEKLQAQLREQAIRDPLTGLYNRRYLAEALEREIAQAERSNHPISAIIMDVDHFKAFNDKYGHKCGDQVLEYMGRMMLSNTRRGDIVCRYGGEEFVIIMPKVGLEVAEARAENWRKSFANAVISYEGQDLRAQLSAGVASYPVGVGSGEDLLKAADQALYYSKAHGRNRVTTYPFETVNEAEND